MYGVFYHYLVMLSIPISIILLVLYFKSKKQKQLIAALLWLIPPVYELWIYYTCGKDCNIRVDLFLVIPIELFILIPASIHALRPYKNNTTT